MSAKKSLICITVSSLLVLFSACSTISIPSFSADEVPEESESVTSEYVPTERKIPDYMSLLKENLGVVPVSSTFDELTSLAQAMKEDGFYYQEDEEHNYCTLFFNGNQYYVIRYEKAQEWFEYYFSDKDYLDFEKDNYTLIINDESYTGPEGMLMWYRFRAFVDDSGRFLIIANGYEYVPYLSSADIKAFNDAAKNI